MEDSRIQTFVPVQEIFVPNIMVLGAGGAGGNVVTRMVSEGVQNVRMVVCNTDQKALQRNKADVKIDLGRQLTRGMGAGARPEIGAGAAEDSIRDIENVIKGSHMIFIAAGMGGGTGTGAAPVVARVAHSMEVLTVAIVTLPFAFEGKRRMKTALEGVEKLREHTDTLLVIPNDKLYDATTINTSLIEAFHLVDTVLMNAIQGITDLVNGVGDINVDFADVQTIMQNMGKAVIGKGTAAGKDRMNLAMQDALQSSLMEEVDIRGAKGILVHVLGPADTSAFEISEAMGAIENLADEDVNLIWGATFDEKIEDYVTITIIATGLDH